MLAKGFDIKVHCHMMRHACGYYLVNQGYNTREIQIQCSLA
ncbi:hypothetical protein [Nostoc sp. LEGE 12450]|nr:hypothetical protein [Nostoc sp. LEGE 12450]